MIESYPPDYPNNYDVVNTRLKQSQDIWPWRCKGCGRPSSLMLNPRRTESGLCRRCQTLKDNGQSYP